MPTLGDLVEAVVSDLNQFTTNQERTGTFVGWLVDDALNKTGVQLADISSDLTNARVELASGELIHVTSYSLDGGTATCPPWFRAQMGTPLNDEVDENTRVVVNPQWPRYQVAKRLVDGIRALNADLFAVAETELTSQPLPSNYELPSDCVGILNVTIEEIGPSRRQWPFNQWTLDTKNTDGKTYLRMDPLGIAGRTVRVTYRKAITVPDPADLTSDWTDTGLPESAADLPGLWAKAVLILSPEAARSQQQAVEQGERQRTLQGWSASAVSRRWQELYATRLDVERRKLRDLYPVHVHKELNG